MKASELRIGNIVTDIWAPKGSWKIIKFDNKKAWYGTFNCRLDNLMPVILNEDLLIKLGFRKEHDEPFNWSDRKKYLQDCFLIGNYSDGLHYVRNGLKTGKPLLYVHQLQNLYHALTSEELTI